MRKTFMALILLAGILSFGISEAVQTKLVVRAKSKDAKRFMNLSLRRFMILPEPLKKGNGRRLLAILLLTRSSKWKEIQPRR